MENNKLPNDGIKPFAMEDVPIEEYSALNEQIGGKHYKKCKIQPIEFIHANNIPFMEANCIKYLCRHKDKNGAQDIKKVIHYCQLILELEYGEKGNTCQDKHEGSEGEERVYSCKTAIEG